MVAYAIFQRAVEYDGGKILKDSYSENESNSQCPLLLEHAFFSWKGMRQIRNVAYFIGKKSYFGNIQQHLSEGDAK